MPELIDHLGSADPQVKNPCASCHERSHLTEIINLTNTSSDGGERSLQLGLNGTHTQRLGLAERMSTKRAMLPVPGSHEAFIHWYVNETSETVLSPNLMPGVEKGCH